MAYIVAIGGGDIRELTTAPIDKEIIRLSGRVHPRLTFIPTASSDNQKYWELIDQYFKKLGCRTDVLFLVKERPSYEEIKRKILMSDIIYVGGGNTLMMMKVWRATGVDILLKQAYKKKNLVLCGMSAGSICWFDSGHSDSMSFYSPKNWEYIKVRGLGLLKGIHCPHFNGQTLWKKRRDAFKEMIGKGGGFGIGIDNNCAIEFSKGKFRIIKSKKHANAYGVFRDEGMVKLKKLPQTKSPLDIRELYSTA